VFQVEEKESKLVSNVKINLEEVESLINLLDPKVEVFGKTKVLLKDLKDNEFRNMRDNIEKKFL